MTTRNEAVSLGAVKYRTGRPCRRGHDAPRYVSTGMCVECVKRHAREAHRARNDAMAARAKGATPLMLLVHPDDVSVVRELAEALSLARLLTAPSTMS
jgi:hypothetical protein